jgi:hypothetical protein
VTTARVLFSAAVLASAAYVWIYAAGLAELPIRSDGFSYYVYLPSWFLLHDTTLHALARDCCGGQFPHHTAIIRWPGTARWVNAHPIGVAVMQAPFFPVAHALTRWTNLSPDGFTLYYQHAAGLSGLAWMVAGVAMLGRLLRTYFADAVVAMTLLVLLLGTNLFHYGTFDSSYSHVYSFFLVAALMYLTAHWHAEPTRTRSILLGLAAGLIILVRHPNVLVLVSFALYGATSRRALEERLATFARHRRSVAIIGLVAGLVVLPQLLIYFDATGRLIVSSYGTLGFNWSEPRLAGVLFSAQKGLFFWSPVLLLAVAGFVLLWRSGNPARAFIPGAIVFLLVNAYVIASWWDWQFGGSYGHRGFVDALPVFALGLASVFDWAARSRVRRHVVGLATALLVALSVFQMLQYWHGLIPFANTTWDQYQELFLQWR